MKKIGMVLVALFLVLSVFTIPSAYAGWPKPGVLIYYGNGGVDPDHEVGPLTDYYGLKALYDAKGFPATYTDIWPSKLLFFKLIILLGPGTHDDAGTNFFSDSQVSSLKKFLRLGGHLVVLGDNSGAWGINTINDLLGKLGVSIRQNADWVTEDGDSVPPLTDISRDLLTFKVKSLDQSCSSSLTLSGRAKSLLRAPAGETVMAVDRRLIGFVLVTGDFNIFDDWALTDPAGDGVGDWAQFAMNLVLFG